MREGFVGRLSTELQGSLADSGVNLGGLATSYVTARLSSLVMDEVYGIIIDPVELNKAKTELIVRAQTKKAAADAAAVDAAAKAKIAADAAAYQKAVASITAEAFAKAYSELTAPAAAPVAVAEPAVKTT